MAGVAIQERMAGWILLDEIPSPADGPRQPEVGVRYPFEFVISAFCNSFIYPFPFRFNGTARFLGFPLSAERPLADEEVPIRGTMTISHQGVAYDYQGEGGPLGSFSMSGAKRYKYVFSWSRIRASLVTLPLEITWQGRKIGRGELRYLPPLYHFPFGVRLRRGNGSFDSTEHLSGRLMALGRALLSNYDELPDRPQARRQVQDLLGQSPIWIRLLLSMTLSITEFVIALRFFTRLSNLGEQSREKFSRFLMRSRLPHLALMPAINLVFGSLFGTRAYRQLKGQHIPVPPTQIEDEPWVQLHQCPTGNLSEDEIDVDVAIVGSGAGGAACAYQLARKGHAVLVIEEGAYFKRPDLNGERLTMASRLYSRAGNTFVLGNGPIWLPTGKCVGGTTTINSGTVMRPAKSVLKTWQETEGLHELKLESYFPEVEEMLNATPTPQKYQGGIRQVLERGVAGLGITYGPLMRAEKGCDGQSYCTSGCPTAAKQSTDVSYMKEALKENAFLFSRYRVHRLLVERGEVKGLVAHLPNYGPEFTLRVRARKVVLACGAFGTPHLLWKSGLHKGLPQLGRNLTIHPALTVGAMFDYRVRESQFVPQSMAVHGHGDGRFVLEGYTLPVDVIPLAFGCFGNELNEIMNRVDYFTNFSAMLTDQVNGHLRFNGSGATPIYWINDKTKGLIRESLGALGEIFFRAGALAVYPSVSGFNKVTSREELRSLIGRNLPAYRYALSAHHPLGTCRMGSGPKNSVIDSSGEVWGTKNLHVADGSAIPGPLGVNPQVTIMANALRVADIIHERLS